MAQGLSPNPQSGEIRLMAIPFNSPKSEEMPLLSLGALLYCHMVPERGNKATRAPTARGTVGKGEVDVSNWWLRRVEAMVLGSKR